VRDAGAVKKALEGISAVVHLAAETGTGQSMYEIERYFDVNVQGTAVLLAALTDKESRQSIEKVVVASSRAIYGEGAYACDVHGKVFPEQRSRKLLESGRYDPVCPVCADPAKSIPTAETTPLQPLSVYGLTKQVQEQAILLHARTMEISAFALRYQNVFGPGQSLKNPYTGILAVFSTLARAERPIEVYEDGIESRDFVFVNDVVEGTVRALGHPERYVGSLNIGSGVATSVHEVATRVNGYFGGKSQIRVTGAYRFGDIRHNRADTSLTRSVLGFEPKTSFSTGLNAFLDWAKSEETGQQGAYENSVAELAARGLMGKART
jgi:dTDP-L-rhamnose 4-epimerase